MTEIKGYIGPTRRPGELGIHSVDHFHFVVPDLKEAQRFYTEFGLDVSERGNRLALGTRNSPTSGASSEGARARSINMCHSAHSRKTSTVSPRACGICAFRAWTRRPASIPTGYGSAIMTAISWKSP